eukprot:1088264-Prymnesium_polylepis.1
MEDTGSFAGSGLRSGSLELYLIVRAGALSFALWLAGRDRHRSHDTRPIARTGVDRSIRNTQRVYCTDSRKGVWLGK